jgi:organic radical activating enzyme
MVHGMTLNLSTPEAHQLNGTVPTSEVYGPVWQGEGPFTGRLCYFLRLGLCNLHCSWCDTAYTWDHDRYDVHSECPPRNLTELVTLLPTSGLLVLSGGEPLIHQGNPVLQEALDNDLDLHVETNGTLIPNDWAWFRVSHFTVSPKLAYQGDPEHRRIRVRTLQEFARLARDGRAIFKVVVRDDKEVATAFDWFERLEVPEHARWVMPEGVEADVVLDRARQIAPAVAARGLNLTLRQHVLMYGTERLR